ncbi:MAG: hypothetical protein HZB25_13640 [Candidatus Eisenbacteria bacterium]|nr:hypothetical protein [Candidatus Eisenbacteria bacterium]
MSRSSGSIRARLVTLTTLATLVGGAALLILANTLVLGVRADTVSATLLLNEGLLLLSLTVLQALLVGAWAGRALKPLARLARLLDSETPPPAAVESPAGHGEARDAWHAGMRLLQRHEAGQRALDELQRVRADADRLRAALTASASVEVPGSPATGETLAALARALDEHLGEIQEWRGENAAVAVQVETEGREAVLAARDAAAQAETAYLEATGLGVALRDLSRVIGEVRPILEAEHAPAGASGAASGSLLEVCRMLADIADRHRGFAIRISREWSRGPEAPPEFGVALLEDLQAHLEGAERVRQQAEKNLQQAPERTAELPAPVRGALKKLLQSAEISGERLVRLTAAAERASSAARRATALAERELQSLEALGVRLEGESGPMDSAETLGESDLVVEPES